MDREVRDDGAPLVGFDQTNGVAEGLDGDSDGTAANDLARKEAARSRAFADTVIGGAATRTM